MVQCKDLQRAFGAHGLPDLLDHMLKAFQAGRLQPDSLQGHIPGVHAITSALNSPARGYLHLYSAAMQPPSRQSLGPELENSWLAMAIKAMISLAKA